MRRFIVLAALVSAFVAFMPADALAQTVSGPASAAPGATISVSWANPTPLGWDWIGLFPQGAANSSAGLGSSPMFYDYTCSVQYPTPEPAGLASGSCSMTLPTTAGNYELRLEKDGGWGTVLATSPLVIGSATATPTPTGTPQSQGSFVADVRVVNQASITIAHIPGGFAQLTLEWSLQTTGAAAFNALRVGFNGDMNYGGPGLYDLQELQALNGAVTSGPEIHWGHGAIGRLPEVSTHNSPLIFDSGVATLFDYDNPNTWKTMTARDGFADSKGSSGTFDGPQAIDDLFTTTWESTAPVTSIELFSQDTSTLLTGRVRLRLV